MSFHYAGPMASKRTTNARLDPGQDSIDRVKPSPQPNGGVRLNWSYRPLDGSKLIRKISKGPTAGVARRRARQTLNEIKSTGLNSAWRSSSDMVDYVEQVSKPAVEKAKLAPLSLQRYEHCLALIVGDCILHRHQHSLKNHTIASGSRFQALEDLLIEVANLHGRETARQTRTVLTKYVLTRLTRDELIQGNPIAGVALNELTGTKKTPRARGGKSLSASEYETVVGHLLGLDPAEGVVRRQGRWTLEHLIAKRRNAIDQALLQAATGLRSTEANLITWNHLTDDGAAMSIQVTEDIAKGSIPRTALVLDDRVAEHLRIRRQSARSSSEYVIGAPTDPSVAWERRNRNKAAQALYLEVAKDLQIKALENERSHVWRTTLHTLHGDGVPTAVLDSQFGNSEQIRAKHYTDPSDLSALKEAAERTRRR